MKRLLLAAAAASLLAGVAPVAQAQPNWLPFSPLQDCFFGGHRYCWYDDGWNGPGWYVCNYAWYRGYGWGGPEGWHGWRGGGRDWDRDRGRGGDWDRRGGWDRDHRGGFDHDRGAGGDRDHDRDHGH